MKKLILNGAIGLAAFIALGIGGLYAWRAYLIQTCTEEKARSAAIKKFEMSGGKLISHVGLTPDDMQGPYRTNFMDIYPYSYCWDNKEIPRPRFVIVGVATTCEAVRMGSQYGICKPYQE